MSAIASEDGARVAVRRWPDLQVAAHRSSIRTVAARHKKEEGLSVLPLEIEIKLAGYQL